MGKSVAMEYVPYVPCSKMNPCELGSISKSLEAAMVKLQALTKGYEGDVHTRSAISTHGVPREPKPPDLCHGEHHLPYECSKSSPTHRSKGKTPLLPSFNGENSRTFVSWLYDVECYFESKCFSEKRKLELVVSCLKGSSLLWYNGLTLSRIMEGKGRVSSWTKLELYMRLKFLPSSTMNELWAELETLKQNSLSVHEYARLFEELHLVCDNEVSSYQRRIRFYLGLKTEIARGIKLGMTDSYGELLELALDIEKSLVRPKNHEVLAKGDRVEAIETDGKEDGLSQGVVMPCLNLTSPKTRCLEPKILSTYAEMNSSCSAIYESPCLETETPFNLTHELTSEEENSHVLSYGVINDQATDLDPREVIVNQGLLNFRTTKLGQSMVMFKGVTCWDSSKGKAKGESWVVSYSSIPNTTSYTSHDRCSKAYILGGITCTLSSPHFHFYMLMRLQASLVHLGAISCESRREMDQVRTYCSALKLMSFKDCHVQNHCEKVLGLLGTSSTRSLNDVEGVVAHLVLLMMSPMYKNRNSLVVSLVRFSSVHCSHMKLKYNAHLLYKLPHYILEVKIKQEPPWLFIASEPLGLKAYVHLLEDEHSKLCSKGNEAARIENHSYDKIQFHSPIVLFDPGGARGTSRLCGHDKLEGGWSHLQAEMSTSNCAQGSAHFIRPRQFFMVFDPGGSMKIGFLKYYSSLKGLESF